MPDGDSLAWLALDLELARADARDSAHADVLGGVEARVRGVAASVTDKPLVLAVVWRSVPAPGTLL